MVAVITRDRVSGMNTMGQISRRRGFFILAGAVFLFVAVGSALFNHISLEATQHRLQARADHLAFATLMSAEIDDHLALAQASVATGHPASEHSSSLRRFRSGSARAIEVMLIAQYAPPVRFPGPATLVPMVATGKAMTWR